MGVKKIGHVGIYVNDIATMKRFYTDMVGLEVTDETPNAVFMSADPEREHHELLLAASPEGEKPTRVQQLSFSCDRLEDVIDRYNRFKEHGVRFSRVVSHGNAIGLYFYDPEGNLCEVYWTTPFKAHQPFAVAVDLTQPIAEIMREVEETATKYAETGFRDEASFVRQRQSLIEQGIRV